MFRIVVVAIIALLSPAAGLSVQINSAIAVNGVSISDFEIDQRTRMLRVLGVSGNLRQVAEDALINDRLFLQEAERLGISVTADMVEEGLSEYASRRNQSADRFLRDMRSNGVTTRTINEFIRAGVAWRTVVRQRFSGRALEISEAEIDRALALRGSETRLQLQLSEVAMSYRPATKDRVIGIANSIVNSVRTSAEFAEAARSLSEAQSASRGGSLGWVYQDNIPAYARELLQRAPVGKAVGPVTTDNAIFVFFKHNTREIEIEGRSFEFDYATLRIYGDSRKDAGTRAGEILRRVETCNDLLAESQPFPKGSYYRQTTSPDETLDSLKRPLDSLDAGEAMTLPASQSSLDTVVVLMLCERKPILDPEDRRTVLQALRSERVNELAQDLITNLRASAIITR